MINRCEKLMINKQGTPNVLADSRKRSEYKHSESQQSALDNKHEPEQSNQSQNAKIQIANFDEVTSLKYTTIIKRFIINGAKPSFDLRSETMDGTL